VTLHRERAVEHLIRPTVIAHGRGGMESRGRRRFGFKAHFKGETCEPLMLFFHGSSYVGINHVENGYTNVCGLATEPQLVRTSFDIDAFLDTLPQLRTALSPLCRSMPWMTTGPLIYGQRLHTSARYRYPAGDALSFVDPFTGSGLLCALLTGRLAGMNATTSNSEREHLDQCGRFLRRPFLVASLIRLVFATSLAAPLAERIPLHLLVQGTRPAMDSESLKL
jgi:hypothetical protein